MSLTIQPVSKFDLAEISAFIKNVYNQAIAPTYSDEGNKEFYKYIELDALKTRFSNDHWMIKAVEKNSLVGIIEIRQNEHLSMLFVDNAHQKTGIGRQLLKEAIMKLKMLNPTAMTLSVHSTPNAVPAYIKLGFLPIAKEQVVNGIKFVTMEKTIK